MFMKVLNKYLQKTPKNLRRPFLKVISGKKSQPSQHLPFQSQQWKSQNNLWNLFKVTNKDNQNFKQVNAGREPVVFITQRDSLWSNKV